MSNDEQAIRDLIATWLSATEKGDLAQILSLMAEDVVFLVAGQPPMRGRDAFAAGFQKVIEHNRIESSSEIQEVHLVAYCWNHLSVTITPLHGGSPNRRTGNTLTVLRKQPDGGWVVFRDANLLAEVGNGSV